VLNSEIFDLNTRSLGQANAAANNWLWNFIVARFTEQMFNTMGYGVYFFFASLMILSAIFVFLCVPETKSIPLEAVDRLFSVKPAWRANGIVMSELSMHDDGVRQHIQDEKAEAEQVETKDKMSV
jgi:hypothetical protein